jgi:hypothetical protein
MDGEETQELQQIHLGLRPLPLLWRRREATKEKVEYRQRPQSNTSLGKTNHHRQYLEYAQLF